MSLKSNQCIEVERKFMMDEIAAANLIACGAQPTSSSTFRDVYFDTSHYNLCLNNLWLRLRNGHWELKSSAASESGDQKSLTTRYQEITNTRQIIASLEQLFATGSSLTSDRSSREREEDNEGVKVKGVKADVPRTDDKAEYKHLHQSGSMSSGISLRDYLDTCELLHTFAPYSAVTVKTHNENSHEIFTKYDDIEEVLHAMSFKKLADITTTRKTYEWQGLKIDVDSTDFGFEVAEIEKVVHCEADIEQAETEIAEFAKYLGVPDEKHGGKMEAYLKINQPRLLEELRRLLIAV